MRDWVLAQHNEIQVLTSDTFTDEATTTGVFRSTLYRMCNLFVRCPGNFKKSGDSPTGSGKWGDPPTSPRSILDVACYTSDGKCICGIEHKRKIVLSRDRMARIQAAASQLSAQSGRGILITVRNDGLVYENIDADEKDRGMLSQVRHGKAAAMFF